MALIGRFIVILFAIFVATLAAGIAIAVGVLGPQWHAFSGDFSQRADFWVAVFFGTGFAGAVGFLPAVILIALAEAFKVRSLLVHLVVGAALLVAGYYASGLAPPSYEESIDHPPPVIPRTVELAAAAGAVFGASYWLIAGRNAGRWRERRQPSA
jgi:hypothetical protein